MQAGFDTQELLKKIHESGHKKVKVAVTDSDGILRGKYLHIDKFASALKNGFGFCNVLFGWDSSDTCYDERVTFTGWHSGYPDVEVRLDPRTLRFIPWENNVPFMLGECYESSASGNTPLAICPRQVLKKVISGFSQLGFGTKVGCEFEWFNFQETPESLQDKNFCQLKPLTPGMFGYSLLRSSLNQEFFTQLMDAMPLFNVPLEGLHTETGPGVLEAAIVNTDALEAADRGVLFKTGTKEIAQKLGIMPTFMAKWNVSLPGSSGHLHQSLIDLATGKPVFYDEHQNDRMSSIFKSFVAGQLKTMGDFLVLMAPTVNSYKRLVEGFWAPTRATWGFDNRTCALRIFTPSSSAARVEVRVPGSDINPYLAIAASLAGGLYGVKHGLKLEQKPVVGSGYRDEQAERLPKNLLEAAQRFRQSEIACELLGENFVEHYAQTRIWEWEASQKVVTDWELKRYLEII